MKCSYIVSLTLALILAMSLPKGFAQDTEVSGTVEDASSGETLPGVNIIVKGTSIGTSTDPEGQYELSVPSLQDTLMFSFIGYQTEEVPINGRTKLNIKLQPQAIEGEEVVVVGYGSQRKQSVVGSIGVTSSEDIERAGAVSDLSQSLTGKVPGVTTLQSTGQPGSESVQFYIRGNSTWNGGEPLVLVDGVQRDISNVDRNEVENISVLKDASATAVYGVEGANGVILITTKRGSESQDGPNISFEASMSGKQISKTPTILDAQTSFNMMNDIIEYEVSADEVAWTHYTPQAIIDRYGTEEYEEIYPDIDWKERMIKDMSMSRKFTLNISGGSDFAQYYGMLSYLHEGDLFKTMEGLNTPYDPSYEFDRVNYRSNFDFDLTETTDLKVNVGGYLGFQKSANAFPNNENRLVYRVTIWGDPATVVPRYEDGTFGYNPEYRRSTNFMYYKNTQGARRDRTAQVTTDIEATQDLDMFLDGLSVSGRVSYDITTHTNGPTSNDRQNWLQKYIDPGIIAAENAADSASYIRYNYERTDAGFEYQRPFVDFVPEQYSINSGRDLNTQLYYEASLKFDRDFNDHSVTALALFNRRENKFGNDWQQYRENWVGRVTYNYDQRYFLELNGSYSGSEKFGPGYKFDFFPSAAVGYNIANEDFFPFEFINQFKIRYSHGTVGSDQGIARWQHISSFNRGGTARFGTNFNTSPYTQYSVEKIPNPNAHWATALKQNLGLDAEFWDGKVSLGFDRFWENRTDIFVTGANRAIPNSFGAPTNPPANLGETKTRGFEVQLEVNQPINKKLAVWGKINFTHSIDEVISRDDPELLPFYQKDAGYQIGQNTGNYPTGFLDSWDDVYASTPGINSTERMPGDKQVADFNGDGIIDNADAVPWGYPNRPNNTWSSTIGANYGGWSFSAQFYGVFNINRYTQIRGFPPSGGRWAPLAFKFNQRGSGETWWPTDQNVNDRFAAGFVGLETGSSYAGYHTKDGSYIRLKNANISYSFGGEQLSRLTGNTVSDLRVYVSGYNLLYWAPDLPMDVETGNSNTNGINYPLYRRFNIGVDISF